MVFPSELPADLPEDMPESLDLPLEPDAEGWYDARFLMVEGMGWPDTEAPFQRLPARAKGVVRDPVWDLSQHSAGILARFVTDAVGLSARWTPASENLSMPHMPATGVSGLDLYARESPRGPWRWVGTGAPQAPGVNEAVLAGCLPGGEREYALYLPLYNGVGDVRIKLDGGRTLQAGPERPEVLAQPLCVYGTSIVQGGCASRPGMAYPAILGRWLDRPVINLGFSGNGLAEPEMGDLLAELEPAAYVLDCLPNLDAAGTAARVPDLVIKLRSARPDCPIVLVENIIYANSWLCLETRAAWRTKNEALREAYDGLRNSGVTSLYYVKTDDLLGLDGEATVDGVHPTDVGFLRMAEALAPALKMVLEA
jgi:lysophospholipase L1-like esterase